MKKVLAAVATVLAFTGLSGLVIFFAETTTNRSLNLSPSNLTADISANVPVDGTADIAANTTGDGTAAPTDAEDTTSSTPQDTNPVVASDTNVSDAGISASTSTDIATTTDISGATNTKDTASATTDQTNTPPAVPPPQFIAPDQLSSTTTSTDASATITVTTFLPAPPPAPPTPPAPPADSSSVPAVSTVRYSETDFRGDANWQTTWGTMDTTWSGAMDLSAGAQSTGGAVYLTNSLGWSNYTFSANFSWTDGKTFGLMADYLDASNYVLCEYNKSAPGTITMRLEQFVNGIETFLTPGFAMSWNGDASNLIASIKVGGAYGTCSIGGQTVSNSAIGPGNSAMTGSGTGGIGFMINNPTPGVSGIIVSSVTVN